MGIEPGNSNVFSIIQFVKDKSLTARLKHWTDDQHGLGSKPTCAILLCPWERHFTAPSSAGWLLVPKWPCLVSNSI